MTRIHRRRIASASATVVLAAACALPALADSTPIGPLPSGPTATIQTAKGELVAVALPHRAGGRVWRIARPFDSAVLQQLSEADVSKSVVLVFTAKGRGKTTLTFALTRGERATAYESRRFVVSVR